MTIVHVNKKRNKKNVKQMNVNIVKKAYHITTFII